MAQYLNLAELFEGKKPLKSVLTVSAILLLILELAIYVAVLNQSGLKSRIVVNDANGVKIHESTGTALTAYEKMVFESNFGPLRDYNTHLETELVPFPLRTWVLLSIGIPMGLILLLSFLVQVWLFLLNGPGKEQPGDITAEAGGTRFGSFLSASRHFTVLHVGFAVVSAILILWLVPSFLGDAAKACFSAVSEYHWFFVGLAVFAGALVTWIIYLRYRLSARMLSNQLEIEKYRIKTQSLPLQTPVHLLPGEGAEEVAAHVIKRGEP